MHRRIVRSFLFLFLFVAISPVLQAQDLNAQLKEIDEYAAKAGVDIPSPRLRYLRD